MTLQTRPQWVEASNSRRRPDAEELADGKWDDVLAAAGFPSAMLHRRHQPCPTCGGKDRFKFYNLKSGKNWCNVCGMSSSGMNVLMSHLGVSFIEACNWIREHFDYGTAAAVAPRPPSSTKDEEPDVDALREKYRKLWQSALPIEPGTPAWLYLMHRTGGRLVDVPKTLRWTPALDYWEEASEADLAANPKRRFKKVGTFPVMLAAVQGQDDRMVNIHRYFVTSEGRLANVSNAKKTAGRFLDPQPFAIRTGVPGDTLGIGEGLENALVESLSRKFPIWATVNAGGMAKFDLPDCAKHVERVFIFGDNDAPDARGRRAGNEALKALAARLRSQGRQVIEFLPASTRYDFADIRLGLAKTAA